MVNLVDDGSRTGIFDRIFDGKYPLVIKHSYGKSQILMGKLAINGHFQ